MKQSKVRRKPRAVRISGVEFGGGKLAFIAGPDVIESERLVLSTAERLAEIAQKLGVGLIFKSSFDKANRTSINSFRGPGIERGLEALARVREKTGLPVTSDIHLPEQAAPAAEILDLLQIPAFLCRQTDLLVAAGETGCAVNIKKAQFAAPWDMINAVEKVRSTGNNNILLTERGSSFGYNTLVVDMTSIAEMAQLGCPVIMDATHSVQRPGGLGSATGGKREHIPLLARAAVAAGCDGVFMEVHPNPDKALCDGPSQYPLRAVEDLLKTLLRVHSAIREDH